MRDALETLREPLPGAYLKDLRQAYEAQQRDGEVGALLAVVRELEVETEPEREIPAPRPLTRADLHLVCWEYVGS